MEVRKLTNAEVRQARNSAIPIKSLGVVEGRSRRRAILFVRLEEFDDVLSLSAHPEDLIESLRRAADELEKMYGAPT